MQKFFLSKLRTMQMAWLNFKLENTIRVGGLLRTYCGDTLAALSSHQNPHFSQQCEPNFWNQRAVGSQYWPDEESASKAKSAGGGFHFIPSLLTNPQIRFLSTVSSTYAPSNHKEMLNSRSARLRRIRRSLQVSLLC